MRCEQAVLPVWARGCKWPGTGRQGLTSQIPPATRERDGVWAEARQPWRSSKGREFGPSCCPGKQPSQRVSRLGPPPHTQRTVPSARPSDRATEPLPHWGKGAPLQQARSPQGCDPNERKPSPHREVAVTPPTRKGQWCAVGRALP